MKYSERMSMVKPSAIRDSQKKIAAKVASGGSVISFAAGLPDPNLFPLKEITEVEKAYYKITGQSMEKVYRDPRGEWSIRDLQIMKDLGYKTYFYSADYKDFAEDVTKEYALAELTKRLHNGAIYLIHPCYYINI